MANDMDQEQKQEADGCIEENGHKASKVNTTTTQKKGVEYSVCLESLSFVNKPRFFVTTFMINAIRFNVIVQ